jgi:Fur family ferric uptake transcriptional regulator
MKATRMTAQKKIILDTLSRSKEHPSADMVYEQVRRELPRISLGTVYRNLESLAQQGVIVRIETTGGQKRFDYNVSPHPHFRCETCGKIEDIPLDLEAPDLDGEHPWVKERKITVKTLNYQGLCSECVKKLENQG